MYNFQNKAIIIFLFMDLNLYVFAAKQTLYCTW